jgi:hypothetical protein
LERTRAVAGTFISRDLPLAFVDFHFHRLQRRAVVQDEPEDLEQATLDSGNSKYSWSWEGVTPGPHTMVSRVTNAEGNVQPTADELKRKKTFPEDNSQFPPKVTN